MVLVLVIDNVYITSQSKHEQHTRMYVCVCLCVSVLLTSIAHVSIVATEVNNPIWYSRADIAADVRIRLTH